MRRPSTLTVAVLLSMGLHLAGLVSPGWELPDPPGDALRLEARLSEPPAPAAPKPVAPKPKPRAKPAPLPPDAPTAQLPQDASTPVEPVAEASAPASVEQRPEEPRVAEVSSQSAPIASSSGPVGDAPVQTPVAQRLPRQGRVKYSGTAGSFLAIGALGQASWEHDGERFQSRLSAGLASQDGALDYRSTGRLAGSQIISETTNDNRRGRLSTGLIDQAGGKVTMQRGGDTRERQIKGLAVAISALPQLLVTLDESVEKAAFFIVGDFWVEDSVLIARGKEFVMLPVGRTETRHYTSRANNGKTVDVWLAPAWRNAPVRIRIESDGVIVDLKATEIEIEGQLLVRAQEAPRED